ncbi:hypothetical protein T12_3264 [Trichinella patagoniensis]|uniref:Transmembrane protein n=1 Tax=Trichinella patagoniensis TaxID=990121 RepID=A0A0V0Z9F5_9BILA|nr:hypothetical protein T12_3264 [Trichinella patagoniensis]
MRSMNTVSLSSRNAQESAFHFCVCLHVNEVVLLVLAITCTVSMPACTHHLRIKVFYRTLYIENMLRYKVIDFFSFNITTALLFVVAVICAALCGFFLSTLWKDMGKKRMQGQFVRRINFEINNRFPFMIIDIEMSALSSVHFLQATSEVVRSWCSHWDRSFLIGFVMDIDHAIVWLFDFLAVPYIRGHVSAWPWLAIGQRTRCFLVMVAQCSYFTIPHFVEGISCTL